MLASLLILAPFVMPPLDIAVVAGRMPPDVVIELEPLPPSPNAESSRLRLCRPECELTLPPARYRAGFRVRNGDLQSAHEIQLTQAIELGVRKEDRSSVRNLGYALLVSTGAMLAATAVVGIATEPFGPTTDWRGEQQGLLFAGISVGIVLLVGVPGTILSLEAESDRLALAITPIL